jgi:hypothetical protein
MSTEAPTKFNKPAWLTPKIWLGANFPGWVRMLVHNRFAIGPRGLPAIVLVTVASLLHTILAGVQELLWGRRVRNVEIRQGPIFIIGHWRSGTTLLHEMLTLDDRFTFPNTYECFNPNHFLLTEWIDTRVLGFLFGLLLPERRPFDNMAMGWEQPQEDEFALCNLGVPSPYQKIVFPNQNPYPEYFDLEQVSPEAREQWTRYLVTFLKQITLRRPKPIILKSPTHTYRVKLLSKIFPHAQFVHIARDPYVVYSSTVHMWKNIFEAQGLQRPRLEELDEYVFTNFIHMHQVLEKARRRLDPGRFHELRYEDLVKNPIQEMRRLYEHLQLGGFEQVLPKLEQYLAQKAGYQTNHYKLDPELREAIRRRWGEVIERYGYAKDEVGSRAERRKAIAAAG